MVPALSSNNLDLIPYFQQDFYKPRSLMSYLFNKISFAANINTY